MVRTDGSGLAPPSPSARTTQRAQDNQVAFLTSLLISETRCKEELERAITVARSDFAAALKGKDDALLAQAEKHRNDVAAEKQMTDARTMDFTGQLSMIRTQLQLAQLQLSEREDDVKGCKDALASAQEVQRLQLEHIQRLTSVVRPEP